MALINRFWGWDPWRELETFSRGMDRWTGRRSGASFPAINVYESEDGYGLEIEVPGVKPEDLELTVQGDLVTVSGSRGEAEGPENYHRRERRSGKFSRSLRLPAALDSGKVEAHYHDGILSAKLPKAPEARARKVSVKAG